MEIIPPVIKSNIEFIITQNDIEKNLIIIESSYNLEFEAYYGYYALYLLDNSIPISLSLIVNDDFVIINDLKKFHKISKSELFSIFEEKRPEFDLKNTKIKNDIRNEIDKKLLSSFSDKEIEQINLSFNQMEFDDTAHLIYHKVIHNIKNNKDYIKYYGIVFRPYIYFNRGAAGTDYYGGVEPIIVKKFKINDKLVKNEEEEGEDCSENDYGGTGSFLSNNKRLELKHHYQDNFSVLEIDCESNENVDYFKLNFTQFLHIMDIRTGISFKYEIILNGNSVKFSNEDFKYNIINDKITIEGYLDKYDEKKFIELAKKSVNADYKLNAQEWEKLDDWNRMRIYELIPSWMELDKK